MSLLALPFPAIDPIIFSIGPLAIRWYAMAYVAGLLLAVWYAKRVVRSDRVWSPGKAHTSAAQLDDLLLWATLGVVLGGRLGYVLFYDFARFVQHPLEALQVWKGGMSFHGGFLGVILACYFFARRHQIRFDQMLDIAAIATPIGLFLGRVANFINGELFGRATDVAWGMVFPHGGPLPRHPSQLYEAALEGVLLFIVLGVLVWRYKILLRPGLAAGIFTAGYGVSRIMVEFFREPDAHIGYLTGGWLTMGMLLSLPVTMIGIWLLIRAMKNTVVLNG